MKRILAPQATAGTTSRFSGVVQRAIGQRAAGHAPADGAARREHGPAADATTRPGWPRHAVSTSRERAFTLIELLTVMAIIGILAAILIPTSSSARTAAKRAKTHAQFAQWAAAIEAFRQEYGFYPTFETTGAGQNKVNGNTAGGTNLTAMHRFYETLVGARRDGSPLLTTTTGNPPPPQAQNTRRIQFITFTEADMVPLNTPDPALTSKRGLIRDAFDNTDIAVLVDRNLDGSIKIGGTGGDSIGTVPLVSPPDNAAVRIAPSTSGTNPDIPPATQGGVRAGVIFYCMPPKGTSANDIIKSWK